MKKIKQKPKKEETNEKDNLAETRGPRMRKFAVNPDDSGAWFWLR
jgi:hypothetical protein